jgi:hypothetical protein
MSERRPTLTLKDKARSGGSDGQPEAETRPNPRKQPARLMPYSMREHPEHEGVVSLLRSAKVATAHEWEKLAEQHSGKILHAALARLPDGERLFRLIADMARTNGQSISTSTAQGNFLFLKKSAG